jgi:hypothetical protein
MGYESVTNEIISSLAPEGQEQSTGTPEASTEPEITQENKDQGSQQEISDQEAQQSNWNPNDWQLKYRDQTITPRDKKHLTDLAQKGFSYSQRLEEMNKREEELNGLKGRYSQYEKLEEAFEKNPEFRKQLFDMYNGVLTPGMKKEGQPANGQSVPPEVLKEIQELKGWKQTFEQQQEEQAQAKVEQEIMGEMDELKKKYTRDDWETPSSNGNTLLKEICQHAYNLGGVKLETAYRDLMWDQQSKNAEAEGRKAAANAQKAGAKAGIVSGGKSKGSVAPPSVDPRSLGYGGMTAHLVKELGLT